DRRNVKSCPRLGAEMADGMGPVQRHRGCRSRHQARTQRLSLPDGGIDHLRRSAFHYLSWLRQRTRWIKGYLQTWLVHMRDPRALWRELGPRGFIAFQIVIAGTVLSALVHPWF